MLRRCIPSVEGEGTTLLKTVHYLRFSEDVNAKEFLEVFDELTEKDSENLPVEAICLKAKISPALILGAALMAARNLSAMESSLTTIIAHPEVVRDTIKFAKLPGATKDREMLHSSRVIGFLPSKSGGDVNVNLLNGNPQLKSMKEEEQDDGDSFEEAFPSLNQNLDDWSSRRHKLLEQGK